MAHDSGSSRHTQPHLAAIIVRASRALMSNCGVLFSFRAEVTRPFRMPSNSAGWLANALLAAVITRSLSSPYAQKETKKNNHQSELHEQRTGPKKETLFGATASAGERFRGPRRTFFRARRFFFLGPLPA